MTKWCRWKHCITTNPVVLSAGFSLSSGRDFMVMLFCVLTTLLVLPIALLLDLRDQLLEMPS